MSQLSSCVLDAKWPTALLLISVVEGNANLPVQPRFIPAMMLFSMVNRTSEGSLSFNKLKGFFCVFKFHQCNFGSRCTNWSCTSRSPFKFRLYYFPVVFYFQMTISWDFIDKRGFFFTVGATQPLPWFVGMYRLQIIRRRTGAPSKARLWEMINNAAEDSHEEGPPVGP